MRKPDYSSLQVLTFIYMALLLGTTLTSCGTIRSTVGIPAQEEFVLGESEINAYRAELKNLGDKGIEVMAMDKKTGEVTQKLMLESGIESKVNVSRTEKVILRNPHDTDQNVKVRLNKNVQGMRYQPVGKGNP